MTRQSGSMGRSLSFTALKVWGGCLPIGACHVQPGTYQRPAYREQSGQRADNFPLAAPITPSSHLDISRGTCGGSKFYECRRFRSV